MTSNKKKPGTSWKPRFAKAAAGLAVAAVAATGIGMASGGAGAATKTTPSTPVVKVAPTGGGTSSMMSTGWG